MEREHLARGGGGQHADHETDKDRHHGVGDRADGDQHHAQHEGDAELLDEIEDELVDARGGRRVRGQRYWAVAGVEPGDDSVEHFDLIVPSPISDRTSGQGYK